MAPRSAQARASSLRGELLLQGRRPEHRKGILADPRAKGQKSVLVSGSGPVTKCAEAELRCGLEGVLCRLPTGLLMHCKSTNELQLFLGLAASLNSGSVKTLCILVRNPLWG